MLKKTALLRIQKKYIVDFAVCSQQNSSIEKYHRLPSRVVEGPDFFLTSRVGPKPWNPPPPGGGGLESWGTPKEGSGTKQRGGDRGSAEWPRGCGRRSGAWTATARGATGWGAGAFKPTGPGRDFLESGAHRSGGIFPSPSNLPLQAISKPTRGGGCMASGGRIENLVVRRCVLKEEKRGSFWAIRQGSLAQAKMGW